jgi:hypothetical protein
MWKAHMRIFLLESYKTPCQHRHQERIKIWSLAYQSKICLKQNIYNKLMLLASFGVLNKKIRVFLSWECICSNYI